MFNQQHSIDWKKVQEIVIELRVESPEIAQEIERGAQLIALNTIMQTGSNSYRIFDPAMQQWFQVEFLVKWSCSCLMHNEAKPSHWLMGAFQPVCQHVVASAIFWAASIPTEAKAAHGESEPAHPDAYEQVSEVIQGHIERGDTEFIGGLLWAAGWLAVEKKRGMQL